MKKILHLKHWQLIAILIGFPILLSLDSVFEIMTMLNDSLNSILIPILTFLWFEFYIFWIYSIGVNLYKKLPSTVYMNINTFRIFVFIPAVYILLMLLYMFRPMDNNTSDFSALLFIAASVPLQFISMGSILYCCYFIAKALKSVETQKPCNPFEFGGEMLLVFFFPFGVWVIQPRVNKVFEEDSW